jgi:DNA-binding PadR family transcriptional regulator
MITARQCINREIPRFIHMFDLKGKVLHLAARRDHLGVSRADCFRELKGVSYPELEEILNELENQGLIRVEWTSANQFVVFVTSTGKEIVDAALRIRKEQALEIA